MLPKRRRTEMSNKKSDEMVLETIQQLIKEVKQEIQKKKVITEGRSAEDVFQTKRKEMRRYITENILKVLGEAER